MHSLGIDFDLTNNADPDYAAFYLGLHCLPKYPSTKGLIKVVANFSSHLPASFKLSYISLEQRSLYAKY